MCTFSLFPREVGSKRLLIVLPENRHLIGEGTSAGTSARPMVSGRHLPPGGGGGTQSAREARQSTDTFKKTVAQNSGLLRVKRVKRSPLQLSQHTCPQNGPFIEWALRCG